LEEIVGERRDGPHKPHFDERAGRVYSSVGPGRSAMSPRTDAERRIEDEFVLALVERLAVKAADDSFDQLIVAASARALGAFRAVAPKVLVDKVTREIHGDYVNDAQGRLLDAVLAQ
jgi:protein required for attachment to host cells